MTKKKVQHHVPKFHLRLFSYENNQKQIGVGHLPSGFIYSKATIKDEGALPYFYGKDLELENLLGSLETEASRIICTIINGHLSSLSPDDIDTILLFVLVSINRTTNAQGKNLEINKILREFYMEGNGNHNLEDLTISDEQAIVMSLKQAPKHFHYLDDLMIKVIFNKTPIPFLTSDSPVIKYNMFAKKSHFEMPATALRSRGLQIFFPLNPQMMLALYDGKIYKYGDRKLSYVHTKNTDDIKSLNFFQFLNCHSKVFYNEGFAENQIKTLMNESSAIRLGRLIDYSRVKSTDKQNEEHEGLRIKLPITKYKFATSFIKIVNSSSLSLDLQQYRRPILTDV